MKTAFIIHWTGWNPHGNWFPWLASELHELWFIVIVPRFPTPEDQSLLSWKEKFKTYEKYIWEETLFIAHSVGPSFVLSVLEDIKSPIKACFFVSGFLENIWISEFDVLNKTFTCREFDWQKIKENAGYFYMCHGTDDPYVPLESAQKLADSLWVNIDIIPNGWHLNKESWFETFPYLLEKIKEHW